MAGKKAPSTGKRKALASKDAERLGREMGKSHGGDTAT